MPQRKREYMTIYTIASKLKKNKFLSSLLSEEILTNLVRYLISGFAAFSAEYLLFAFLYAYAGLTDIFSNSIAMAAGFMLSFTLNRVWSFKSKDNVLKQLLLFGILFAINLGISNAAIRTLSNTMGITPMLSKIVVMGVIVVWNFIIYRKVIYKY